MHNTATSTEAEQRGFAFPRAVGERPANCVQEASSESTAGNAVTARPRSTRRHVPAPRSHVPASALEVEFIRKAAGVCLARHLAAALGRTVQGVWGICGRNGIKLRNAGAPPLSKEATAEAWRRFQAGEEITEALRFWWDEGGAVKPNTVWTEGELEELRDLMGTMDLKSIGKRLRRSECAVFNKARQLGLWKWVKQYSAASLRRTLNAAGADIASDTVTDWCRSDRVRSWRRGGWWFVHVEDAEWLAEHYQKRASFPKYPGMEEEERAALIAAGSVKALARKDRERTYIREYKRAKRAQKRNPGYMEVAA